MRVQSGESKLTDLPEFLGRLSLLDVEDELGLLKRHSQ